MPNRNKVQQRLYELLIELDRVCKQHDIQYFILFGTLLGAVRHKGFIPWDDDVDVVMLPKDYEKFRNLTKQDFKPGFFLKTIQSERERFDYWPKLTMDNTTAIDLRLANIDVHWGITLDIFPLLPITDSHNIETQEKIVRKMKFFCRKPLYKNYNYHRTLKDKLLRIVYACIPYFLRNYICEYYLQKLLFPKGEIHKYGDYEENRPDGYIFPKSVFDDSCELLFEDKKFTAPLNYVDALHVLYGENYMELPPENKRIIHDYVYYDSEVDYRKVKYYD